MRGDVLLADDPETVLAEPGAEVREAPSGTVAGTGPVP